MTVAPRNFVKGVPGYPAAEHTFTMRPLLKPSCQQLRAQSTNRATGCLQRFAVFAATPTTLLLDLTGKLTFDKRRQPESPNEICCPHKRPQEFHPDSRD